MRTMPGVQSIGSTGVDVTCGDYFELIARQSSEVKPTGNGDALVPVLHPSAQARHPASSPSPWLSFIAFAARSSTAHASPKSLGMHACFH
jgi:hypothetical protein